MHSSKGEKEANSFISPESVKVVAESVGIGGLPDEASQHLADEVTYRIKQVIQVSTRSRFSTGSNRSYKWVQGQGHIQGQKGHTGLQGQGHLQFQTGHTGGYKVKVIYRIKQVIQDYRVKVIYSFKQVIQVGTRSRSSTGSNRSYRWVQGQGHLQDQTGHTGGYKVKVIHRIHRSTGSRSSTGSNRSYRWVQGEGHSQDQTGHTGVQGQGHTQFQTGHTGGYKVKVICRIKQVIKGGQIRRAIGWVARGLPKPKLRQPYYRSP